MKREYSGSIGAVRDVEDTIRTTKRYTKGAFSKPIQHPVQGEGFPSRLLIEHYEVYPYTDISWEMPAGQAIDWLWGDIPHIEVLFQYDYRKNKATVIVHGGDSVVNELRSQIQGFANALEKVRMNDDLQPVVVNSDRVGVSSIAHP